MEKIAFKGKLNPGMETEYKRRHDEIWPEMAAMLKEAGVSDYSIFLDRETDTLSAVLWRRDDHAWTRSPTTRSSSAGTTTWPLSWGPIPTSPR